MTTPPRPRREVLRGQPFDEAYLYLRFLVALVRPGHPVPLTEPEQVPKTHVSTRSVKDKQLFLEEARAQLAGQNTAMQHNHTRAATLLTVTVAELVFLSSRAGDQAGLLQLVLLALGYTTAILALSGAAAVLTTQARYGTVNLVAEVDKDNPLLDSLVDGYANVLSIGERTNAARLTVLRDAVFLAVLAALPILGLVAAGSRSDGTCRVPPGYACLAPGTPTPSTPTPTADPTTVPTTPAVPPPTASPPAPTRNLGSPIPKPATQPPVPPTATP